MPPCRRYPPDTRSDRRYLTSVGIHAYTGTGVVGHPRQPPPTKAAHSSNHLAKAANTPIALLTGDQQWPSAVAAPVRLAPVSAATAKSAIPPFMSINGAGRNTRAAELRKPSVGRRDRYD
ncbi:hypothetical protein F0Q45_25280 [Mycobacterium simiae]|uniref:Uncharacterized protein n=1 Tax=Mycobacterium simiae TaxID=1784 RepID=A0A5B1B7Y2_MYCSI|nr:hypothetical protein [Mycobacterium simiae]KAA1243945.1 hypothetical protein F0Q45_25280 [Mycobacterium simiae]